MNMTPQELAGTTFRVVKRGFDPEEVRAFQLEAAQALESAQSQASLMEQRARAAVAKAQELSASLASGATVAPVESHAAATSSALSLRADDADVISRTLVLAQRTADLTVAEAQRDAAALRGAAEREAHDLVQQARASAATMVADARHEARRAGESERSRIGNEIQALLARLEFLKGDVREMEAYAAAHRERLLGAADALREVAERPIGAPGELRAPVLSPAAETAAAARPVAPPAPPAPAPAAAPARPAPEPDPLFADEAVPSLPASVDAGVPAPIAPSDSTPGAGSPLLPPLELAFPERSASGRVGSGPVAVPDLDDDLDDLDDVPSLRHGRTPDLRIVGEP